MGDNAVFSAVLQVSSAAEVVVGGIDTTRGISCARRTTGQVRCWGSNNFGQVGRQAAGSGGTTSIGDLAPEMLTYNATAIDLGTAPTRTATQIAAGTDHVCALLDNSTVKCWGRHDNGRLGTANFYANARGDAANEMGNNLLAAQLGANATAIAAGGATSCAILTGGALKCWGSNANGVLGIGNIAGANASIGDVNGEMAALGAINLGTGRSAHRVSVSSELAGAQPFACAILDNRSVKCWGGNSQGQLGINNLTTYPGARGDGAGEMGDALPIVEL
jgi:alpha-tubulin suppressor-like RCC1 family protein